MPNKFADAAVMMAQAATAGIAAGAASVGLDGLTVFGIAASCAGSASAVLFRVVNREEVPVEGMWTRAGRGFAAFLIGATFGVFMGDGLDSLPLVDGAGSLYFGGLVGYGAVAVFLSKAVRRTFSDGVVSIIRGALAKAAAAAASKGGGQ